ncbi:hypothetical protein D3C72_2177040 [compost metagenome]
MQEEQQREVKVQREPHIAEVLAAVEVVIERVAQQLEMVELVELAPEHQVILIVLVEERVTQAELELWATGLMDILGALVPVGS